MLFLLLFQFTFSCDFRYKISNHDPFYLEKILKSGQTLCINTTVSNTIFIFNELSNLTFRIFDNTNTERIFGFEEMIREAVGFNFGKIIGSLVLTNTKSSNSLISIAAISFPSNECEIKSISNQNKNIIFFSFDDSSMCYFNGNGINFRYQFYVDDGSIELRPPHNLSESIFLEDFSNMEDNGEIINDKLFSHEFRSLTEKTKNLNDSPDSIYINHTLAPSPVKFDISSSYVRVDSYSPLIIFKPPPGYSTLLNRSFFMEHGAFSRNKFPHILSPSIVYNEPGIITSSKEDINADTNQSIFYGCDPYLYTYDSSGNKMLVDANNKTGGQYYIEILSKAIISGLLMQLVFVAFIVYLFSFCCICPCCCCYNCCHKCVCCTTKNQYKYHPFDGSNVLHFMQSGNNNSNTDSIENINEENTGRINEIQRPNFQDEMKNNSITNESNTNTTAIDNQDPPLEENALSDENDSSDEKKLEDLDTPPTDHDAKEN